MGICCPVLRYAWTLPPCFLQGMLFDSILSSSVRTPVALVLVLLFMSPALPPPHMLVLDALVSGCFQRVKGWVLVKTDYSIGSGTE